MIQHLNKLQSKGKGIDRRKGVSGRRQEGCVKALLGFTEFGPVLSVLRHRSHTDDCQEAMIGERCRERNNDMIGARRKKRGKGRRIKIP
jgi:hypothetical protein